MMPAVPLAPPPKVTLSPLTNAWLVVPPSLLQFVNVVFQIPGPSTRVPSGVALASQEMLAAFAEPGESSGLSCAKIIATMAVLATTVRPGEYRFFIDDLGGWG